MKANQPDLLEALPQALADDGLSPWERKLVAAERQTAWSTTQAHGRIETRTRTRTTALADDVYGPEMTQAFRRVRQRTRHGKTTPETIYGIPSLPGDLADAEALRRLTRQQGGSKTECFTSAR